MLLYNKSLWLFILAFCCFGKLNAQSFANLSIAPDRSFIFPTPTGINNYLPLSNYHFFNPYYYNPAMAGIDDKKKLNIHWNRQINHAFFASYEQPITSLNSTIGTHFSYTSDYFGTGLYYGIAYNYGVNIKENTKLKLGFQFSQTSISQEETVFNGSFFESQRKWYSSPVLDFGAAFLFKKFRFGVSVHNLFPTTIISRELTGGFFYEQNNGERQTNVSLANTFQLTKKWHWSLATLFRFNKIQNIHDFSSYLSFQEKYYVGSTFRTAVEQRWIMFLGIKFRQKLNLQFSFNTQKYTYEDHRFFEALTQYQF